MKETNKSNMIIEEANGIIENYIKRKTGVTHENKKTLLLLILTISAAVILTLIIKFI